GDLDFGWRRAVDRVGLTAGIAAGQQPQQQGAEQDGSGWVKGHGVHGRSRSLLESCEQGGVASRVRGLDGADSTGEQGGAGSALLRKTCLILQARGERGARAAGRHWLNLPKTLESSPLRARG